MAIHIYHYNTHSEQRYFLGPEHRDLYDMIGLNGNIVSHAPHGIAAFIATSAKDFYIDPQTHAFQHSTINLKRDVSDKDKGESPDFQFKPSIIRLAKERLGTAFAKVIDEDRPISPSDFLNTDGSVKKDSITEISNKVIYFQQNFLTDELDEEARDLIGEEKNLRPKFLIAPYFYLSSQNFDRWLDINLSFYEITRELSQDIPVFLSLVISNEVLRMARGRIMEALSHIKPTGILLWVDEYSEEDLGVEDIEDMVQFIIELKMHTDVIYNSHGGYLSLLLCHSDIGSILDGVGHSINYGESRSVIPIGGGIPMARFYFPSIHSRIRFGDALGIIRARDWLSSAEAYGNVCKCIYCNKLIGEKQSIDAAFMTYGESFTVKSRRRSGTVVSLEYPTKEAKQAAARHYLYNKAHEFSQMSELSLSQLLDNLESNYNQLSGFTGDKLIGHLYNWHSALKKSIS